MSITHVIIGSSAAGIAAAQKIRQLSSDARIIVITAESELPYNKCLLADYLTGSKTREHITLLTPQQISEKQIDFMWSCAVTQLDPINKQILCSNGSVISYDKLLIATGVSPVLPSIPGIDAKGVYTFHHAHDVHLLLDALSTKKEVRVVVIGAGLSGLECADALHSRGARVVVVERAGHLLSRQVTPQGADIIGQAMSGVGIGYKPGVGVTRLHVDSAGCVEGVYLSDDTYISAEIVVCAIGSRPNIRLVAGSNMVTHHDRIVVDSSMKTSINDVYAAGDIVMAPDILSGEMVPSCAWPDAMQQGMIAAHNMVGVPKTYPGVCVITSSAFFGLKFATCGPIHTLDTSYTKIERVTPDAHELFILKDGRLKGFQIIGQQLNLGTYRRYVLTQQPFEEFLE